MVFFVKICLLFIALHLGFGVESGCIRISSRSFPFLFESYENIANNNNDDNHQIALSQVLTILGALYLTDLS